MYKSFAQYDRKRPILFYFNEYSKIMSSMFSSSNKSVSVRKIKNIQITFGVKKQFLKDDLKDILYLSIQKMERHTRAT